VGVLSATVRQEIYAAQSVHAVEDVQFVINWRDDVTTAHVIRYKGVLYDITRVDGFEGYKGDLVVYCKRNADPINTSSS
jgi:SPP1 family predicted phage head-tail adaptor